MVSGKDKGKSGKVIKAMPKDSMIIIEGLNMRKRHQKPQKQGAKGQIVEFAAAMHVSNVMTFVDGARARVGKKLVGDKYVRVSKKTGKTI